MTREGCRFGRPVRSGLFRLDVSLRSQPFKQCNKRIMRGSRQGGRSPTVGTRGRQYYHTDAEKCCEAGSRPEQVCTKGMGMRQRNLIHDWVSDQYGGWKGWKGR